MQEINQSKVVRVFPEGDGDDPVNDDGKVTFRAQVFLQKHKFVDRSQKQIRAAYHVKLV